jgi:hypothetical protein
MALEWSAVFDGAGLQWAAVFDSGGVSVPVITSVTGVSGTEIAVAWTGAATQYRLDGGTPTALPDGTTPDTIGGLTAATEYTVELRNGSGDWSDPMSGSTDTLGEGGGSVPVDLVVEDSVHLHTSEEVTLSTGVVLVVEDSVHLHTSEEVTLTTTSVLSVEDSVHLHTSEEITLNSGSVLSVEDSVHLHTSEEVTLTTTSVLSVEDSVHLHTSEEITLNSGSVLSVEDSVHLHTSEEVTLTTTSVLSVEDSVHLHTSEEIVLSIDNVTLVVENSVHIHTSDLVRLGNKPSTIEEIIPYILNNLFNGRVWESATPDDIRVDGVITPFVVWNLMGGQDSEYVEQTPAPSHSHARVQLHVAALSGIQLAALMKAARDAMLASDYTVGVYGSPVGTYDAARKLKGRFQQFSVWFQQQP